MLVQALLSVTTAVLTPVVCLTGIALLPFSDRKTQIQIMAMWTTYLGLVGGVLL